VRRRALIVLTLALLAATAAAFAVTEALKLERLPVVGPRFPASFSPVCDCPTSVAQLGLRFRVADRVEAAILDADDGVVRSLGERRVQPGVVFFEWDGLDDAGEVVPDGPYRLRVRMEREGRTIVVPNEVLVDTHPPTVVLLGGAPTTFSPDGDGVADKVRIRYRADERAGPLLLVDGETAFERRPRGRDGRVVWDGTLGGELQAPGVYRLAVRVRDVAGNLSPPSEELAVTLE